MYPWLINVFMNVVMKEVSEIPGGGERVEIT